jgi:hypothetical protein
MQLETRDYLAIAAIALTLINLYFTFFRRPAVEMLVAPRFLLCHPEGIGFTVMLPLTFLNKANRAGSVLRAEIAVELRDGRFAVSDWFDFRAFVEAENRWATEEAAHALPITGQSSVTKVVRFVWRGPVSDRPFLERRRVRMFIYAWTNDNRRPSLVKDLSVTITAALLDELNSKIDGLVPQSVLDIRPDAKGPLNTTIPFDKFEKQSDLLSLDDMKLRELPT